MNQLSSGRHILTASFVRTSNSRSVGKAEFFVVSQKTIDAKTGQVVKTGEIASSANHLTLLMSLLAIALYSKRKNRD
ncbi:hypothetical protein [Amygdalobacter nucleatus]|uniref:Uncharacterized protein n=1 Tax=Amygdalobacter nucleatus TaxID=3029274 RepID=A0A133Y7L9_9FIRM|nr:hypothetical protein [Amygdalobacter nucleatus]KXB39206.1 hypothetical protein HMPREF1872_01238 [Amygdalobacter nucleatus]MDF0485466.1 hypothetical protein [Amygdalobacter nucleatus]